MENPESWIFNSFWGQVSLISVLLGIVVWVIYAILTEKLYGKAAMARETKEKEDWKTAYFTEAAAHLITQTSLKETTNALGTTDKLLKTLRDVSSGDSP